MRRRADTASESVKPLHPTMPAAIHSHVTIYKSVQLELQLYSPKLQLKDDSGGPVAAFSFEDKVSGKVLLDRSCHHSGRLSVTLEGTFYYEKPLAGAKKSPLSSPSPSEAPSYKHVFLTSTTCINVCPANDVSMLSFQNTFLRRRPSASCLCQQGRGSQKRVFPFSFEFPRSCRGDEELPSSFSSLGAVGPAACPYAVEYKILAYWEPSMSLDNTSSLEVPILVHADPGMQFPKTPRSWTEIPLKAERPVPVRCAVTLPSSVTFSRSSAIPYFVVFTTSPRSPSLAQEIAADASISVSLIRQITVTEQTGLPPTPPMTPSSEDLESLASSGSLNKGRLLRKVTWGLPRQASSRSMSFDSREKPLPEVPTQTFSESRIIRSDMCIGFQKKPRFQCDAGNHPPLGAQLSLPDGLYKAKISLNDDMIPSMDWYGLLVKYYLDVSVLIGQDELRGRVPLQIT
ncbi:hypothetical protein AGABI2DRAFT_208146 [Agaricus bisporus var. bisporus H97]|uniref:hypothetical protein n=1 Tax=Agaricus bisporus var. bisporus (strain H97 / ATCC MYA-4626 / FGSC 10389) TaxID=936046 RepID=UPI00029F57F9|nr:hypothetical protein AGABI2DRAFT_208146 [Agaricus bisporus var. bisporus H97]EKV45249.1 hypothetical protein AGABI2DRAFT_208146 [Agaricus bisporus var. bisporus H97]